MFVAEAPGYNEVLESLPLVGKAGQLLWKLAGNINLSRMFVHVDNVVQFRPTDSLGRNRTPTPEEIDSYIPTISDRIIKVGPTVIVCFGRTASDCVLGKNIERGQFHIC